MVLSDEDEGFKCPESKRRKKMKKDIMRGLWLAYIAGDEKAFDRVSLRAFREPEKETKKDVKGTVYAIEAVDFEGEE